ncbi:MAG: peptide MFS transporter [Myxococcales bacterium]|nr:peptide MFS transporter [Myxococcales bacterium]
MPSSALATALSADSQSDSQTDSVPTPEATDSRRARALLIACVTIALERFAFYTLISLFVLFLTERRGHSEAQATTWYGVMMGATYFTPLIGGAVADRFGRWLCIAIAAFLLAIAYGLLTVGFLPLSIILLSVGMGLFKGNITAAVGSLYQTETERDLALTRLYWAVNLGALPSGFVGGWLANNYGYSAAFLSATGACLLASCLWMFSGSTLFREHSHAQVNRSQAPEKDRLATIYVLLPVAALFFLSFHQSGSSLTLFAKDHTVLLLLGMHIEAPWFQSVNAGLIITLSPLLWLLWKRWPLASHHKFMLGMFLAAASSLIMSAASFVGGDTGRVTPWWLLTSYFVISVGELCVAPIGFSLVTKLAPKRLLGVLMGAWFAAIAIGNLSAGLIGRYWSVWPHRWFFFALATTSGFAALLLMLQQSRLRKVLGGTWNE